MGTRTIIHADLDAFYAAVEQLDRPELRGKPLVVGGPPESRGVVAAASYEVRRYGVHSAMPMRTALRLCPHAIRVSPRFRRYGEMSDQIMAIFRSLTPLVEPLSLDEAFLDVTEVVWPPAPTPDPLTLTLSPYEGERGYEKGEAIARWLKTEVRRTTGLIVSIGVGTGKAVAKIASDAGKPDGLVVVPAGTEAVYLAPLPARALWGIGPKAEERLTKAGITTIGGLASADPKLLERLLGAWSTEIQLLARGEDHQEVQPERKRKSVGAETTFAQDLPDGTELREELARLVERVALHLEEHGLQAGTVGLKLRYFDFRTITRQASWPHGTSDASQIRAAAQRLLDGVARPSDRFRLVGVHCSRLEPAGQGQLALFPA